MPSPTFSAHPFVFVFATLLTMTLVRDAVQYAFFDGATAEKQRLQDTDVAADVAASASAAKLAYSAPHVVKSHDFAEIEYFDAPPNSGESTNAYAWIVRNPDTGVRTAYVAFRGTQDTRDMLADLDVWETKLPDPWGRSDGAAESSALNKVRVHNGFLCQFKAVQHAVARYLKSRAGQYDRIVFTGHSLGAALAVLAAALYPSPTSTSTTKEIAAPRDPHDSNVDEDDVRFAENANAKGGGGGSSRVPVYCHTFGCPRVGDDKFAAYYGRVVHGANSWRVYNYEDPVPMVPMSWEYKHVEGNDLCLGNSPKNRVFRKGTDKHRVCWELRPAQAATRIDVCRPIKAHDASLYVHKLNVLKKTTTASSAPKRSIIR